MNGRVYNPTLARFVSADPLISNPDDTQNYNRYSYVHNRPMFFTDPSGFETGDEYEGILEELEEIADMTCNCTVVLGGFLSDDLSNAQDDYNDMISNSLSPNVDNKGDSSSDSQGEGQNKGSEASVSDPSQRSSLAQDEVKKQQVVEDTKVNIEWVKEALSMLAAPKSDGYKAIANMYGYHESEFTAGASYLTDVLGASLSVLNDILDNPEEMVYTYTTNGDTLGEHTSQGIGLSSTYFSLRRNYRTNTNYVKSTIIHEVGHHIGLTHVSGKNKAFGMDQSDLSSLAENAYNGFGTYPPNLDAVDSARGRLLNNAYQFEYMVRGDRY